MTQNVKNSYKTWVQELVYLLNFYMSQKNKRVISENVLSVKSKINSDKQLNNKIPSKP